MLLKELEEAHGTIVTTGREDLNISFGWSVQLFTLDIREISVFQVKYGLTISTLVTGLWSSFSRNSSHGLISNEIL